MKKKLHPLLTARGLITVPGALALAIWWAALPALWFDHLGYGRFAALPVLFSEPTYDTMSAVLSTISAAAITTLSLVYSIVLVVFTLAAGTIAPRLLRRFSEDRINQVTAGLLGGTFLYALTILAALRPEFLPVLSSSIAFGLAGLSVLVLIFFVHAVSLRVMIDEEIAEVSKTLKDKLAAAVKVDEEADEAHAKMPEDCNQVFDSPSSGFLSVKSPGDVVAFCEEHAIVIDFCTAPGDFVAEGEPLFNYAPSGAEADRKREPKLESLLTKAVSLTPGREDTNDVVFSLNLLLEIALRALSPGINDTYTAISCTNRLTEVLRAPVRAGMRENIHLDSTGTPRLRIPGLTLDELLKKSIQPLRQCAAGNHLFLMSLAGMLRRLYAVAGDDHSRNLLQAHAGTVLKSYAQTDPLKADLQDLRSAFGPALGKDTPEDRNAGGPPARDGENLTG